MANNDIEFDIKVNGKKAEKSINDVEKAQQDLGKTTDKTSKNIQSNWVAIGAKIAGAVAAVEGIRSLVVNAAALDRATFGLNETTKAYIKNQAIMSGLSEEIIAGFVQTGRTAGMTSDAIEDMIDTAVALGRAYPHESTEGFIDNLTMLNKTGEAQGYVVDILEQKYGTLDLKTISLADKMKTVKEAAAGVNEEFNKTSGAKLQQSISKVTTTFNELGTSILNLVAESGLLKLFDKVVGTLNLSFRGLTSTMMLAKIKIDEFLGDDVSERIKEYNKYLEETDELLADIAGIDMPDKPFEIDVNKGVKKAKTDLEKFNEIVQESLNGLTASLKWNELSPSDFLFQVAAVNEWADEVREAITKGLTIEQALESIEIDFTKSVDKIDKRADKIKATLSSFKAETQATRDTIISELKSGEITPSEAFFSLEALDNWTSEVNARIQSGLSIKEAKDAFVSVPAEIDLKTDFEKEIESLYENIRTQLKNKKITPDEALISMDQIEEYASRVKENLEKGFSLEDAKVAVSSDMEEMKKESKSFVENNKVAYKGIEDAFVTFAQTGKLSFKDMARSILADIAAIAARMLLLNSVKAMGLGSFFAVSHTGTAQVKHTGGFIETAHNGRGMMPDERLIKAQVGEAIINRTGAMNNQELIKKMNTGAKVESGASNVTQAHITFNVQAIDSSSFNQYLQQEKTTIENIINRSITTNGSVRKTISQSV